MLSPNESPSRHHSHLVFVYGTLLRGEGNHRILARARPLGRVVTEPRFELIDLGAYPAMIAGGQTAVRGELYEVDEATLSRLDDLEGHPRYYRRRPIALGDGREVHAYVLPTEESKGCPPIASGDWRARGESSQAT